MRQVFDLLRDSVSLSLVTVPLGIVLSLMHATFLERKKTVPNRRLKISYNTCTLCFQKKCPSVHKAEGQNILLHEKD
jgi:hypothetical protein